MYSNEFKQEIFKFVEANGLRTKDMGLGVTQKALARHFGIDEDTLGYWLKESAFSDSIKRANQIFLAGRVNRCLDNLQRRADGYSDTKVVSKGHTEGNEFIAKSSEVVTVNVPPDVGANIFILTNIDPEHWRNPLKIDAKADLTTGGQPLNISVVDNETKEMAEKLAKKLNDGNI